VKNQRFRAYDVAEYLYEISIVFVPIAPALAIANCAMTRSTVNDIFTAIDSMMSQARQDASPFWTTLRRYATRLRE
jgi:hypothetical protein